MEDTKTVELKSGTQLPADVAVVKMDAYSLAKNMGVNGKPGYTFTIDRVKLCERLRQLAQMVEDGKILPQSVSFTSKAEIEDYTLTTLEFRFAEKVLG